MWNIIVKIKNFIGIKNYTNTWILCKRAYSKEVKEKRVYIENGSFKCDGFFSSSKSNAILFKDGTVKASMGTNKTCNFTYWEHLSGPKLNFEEKQV